MPKILFTLFTLLSLLGIIGCAGAVPANRDVQKEFTYDFQLQGKSKDEIWKSARNHFSSTYGDFRTVFSVQDETEGTFIGKGIEEWTLLLNVCLSEYHIRFIAKDGKARLQYEIIEGVPALSQCQWSFPSEGGYAEMVAALNDHAESLKKALEGQSSLDKMKDF